MKITLKDIAEKSGYSVTTVSRALGGFDDVNETTRQIISKIASDMGYQPNLVARQLQSQKTYTIGFVSPADIGFISPTNLHHIEDDFFTMFIKGVSYTAAQHSYDVLLSAYINQASEMDLYQRIVGGKRVDGMIIARTYDDDPRIKYLKSMKHPFVASGRLVPNAAPEFPYIDVDSQIGICMLVEHFIDYGHQRIGLILPPKEIAYTPYRHAGYQDGLQNANLHYDASNIIYSDLSFEGGYQSAHELLNRKSNLTGIIACNDLMALGAMNAIQERGMQVGKDIVVGGFDDIPIAQYTKPSLTTIRQPIYEIGKRLTDMLIKIIQQESIEEYGIMLEPELIVRDSSGQPR